MKCNLSRRKGKVINESGKLTFWTSTSWHCRNRSPSNRQISIISLAKPTERILEILCEFQRRPDYKISTDCSLVISNALDTAWSLSKLCSCILMSTCHFIAALEDSVQSLSNGATLPDDKSDQREPFLELSVFKIFIIGDCLDEGAVEWCLYSKIQLVKTWGTSIHSESSLTIMQGDWGSGEVLSKD